MTYTEIVYPARILPNQTAKPVPETQKLAECIYDCRTLLQQILTDGLTVLQNSKNPAPSYQQHKAGLSKAISSNFLFYFFFFFFFFLFPLWYIFFALTVYPRMVSAVTIQFIKIAIMQKLYENFHIFHFQKRIVSAETIRGNTVCAAFRDPSTYYVSKWTG